MKRTWKQNVSLAHLYTIFLPNELESTMNPNIILNLVNVGFLNGRVSEGYLVGHNLQPHH